MAKFGIALEWGSRGRWFESSHSDQKSVFRKECGFFLLPEYGEQAASWRCRRVKTTAAGQAGGTPAYPMVRIQSLGANNDNPNYMIQMGSVFGFIISIENVLRLDRMGDSVPDPCVFPCFLL